MSTIKKPPEPKTEPGAGVSRRGFIRDVGLGTGALGVALTPGEARAAAPAAMGPGPVPVTLTINGKPHKLELEPRVTLLDALRNYLDYTGAKRVCDRGTCGACTVLIDGKAVYACSILAIDAQGKNIQTIESLPLSPQPDPLIRAFVDNDGLQCGFCTPGFVMAAKAFLAENPNPTMEQIKRAFGGNLCRCGSYNGIRRAILEAAKSAQGGKNA
jgi:xanthine dehydrogenase YagT iron-sulfur-binding subunit